MIIPVMGASILEPIGGLELFLVDAVQVPNFFATTLSIGNILVGTEKNNAVIKKLKQTGNLSVAGTSLSVHDQATDTDYKTPVSGTTKIILIITTSAAGSNITFKVWEHTVADTTPTGTPEYDFSNSGPLDSSDSQTTRIMTGFAADRFVNVELESITAGSITDVQGWVVEIP